MAEGLWSLQAALMGPCHPHSAQLVTCRGKGLREKVSIFQSPRWHRKWRRQGLAGISLWVPRLGYLQWRESHSLSELSASSHASAPRLGAIPVASPGGPGTCHSLGATEQVTPQDSAALFPSHLAALLLGWAWTPWGHLGGPGSSFLPRVSCRGIQAQRAGGSGHRGLCLVPSSCHRCVKAWRGSWG